MISKTVIETRLRSSPPAGALIRQHGDGDGCSTRALSWRVYSALRPGNPPPTAFSRCSTVSSKCTQIEPHVRQPLHSSPPLRRLPPYFQLRDGLVCAWRWSAGPHMTQGHGIRLFYDHACLIGSGARIRPPFLPFPHGRIVTIFLCKSSGHELRASLMSI